MNSSDLKAIGRTTGLALEPILKLNALAGRLAGALPESIVTGDDERLEIEIELCLRELKSIVESLNEIVINEVIIPRGGRGRIRDNINEYDIHGDPGDVEVVEDPETEARLAELREKLKERSSALPAWAKQSLS